MMKFVQNLRSCMLWVVGMTVLSTAGCATFGDRNAASSPTETQDTKRDSEKARPRRTDNAPKVGDEAPSFALKMLEDDKKTVELTAFRGKKPVVLFFGSYT